MKALAIDEFGGPEAAQVIDLPEPQPGPGEVALQVKAAALNHVDIWVTHGGHSGQARLPHILGTDAAGVVAAVGEGVSGARVGDEVILYPAIVDDSCEFCQRGEHSECVNYTILGTSTPGVFAEQAIVPAKCLLPRPGYLTWGEAATLGVAYLTAWRMVMNRGALQAGESVLIHGIGGGVALAALQFAHLAGATTIVTSSSNHKLQAAREWGATETINYRQTQDLAPRVREMTGGRGVDLAIDAVGAASWPVDIASVRRGGRVVICGVTTGAEATTNLQALYWNGISLLGSTGGSRGDMASMLRAMTVNDIHPVIDTTFPLADGKAAIERLAAGEQFGKIVLQV